MHRTLVDIDANARQPAMPASQLPAKTQGRATPTSAGRRSPFRVSASGSPHYMTPMAKPAIPGLSPAVGSKIPRKAGNATLPRRSPMGAGATSPNGALSASSRRYSSNVVAAASRLTKPARSPPMDRDKPLPSPPFAQYVNPLSPPKAQRTLIDAEVVGTPTSEDWPILPADNISFQDISSPLPVSASSSVYSGDENVEEFAQREDHVASSNDAGRPATAPPGHDYERALSLFVASSPSVNALTPLLGTVHAVTTASDEALESPLARKMAVPPRVSSKRTSLPIRSRQQQPVATATRIATSGRQQKKPGRTKWPLLGVRGGKFSPATSSPLVSKSDEGETLKEFLSSSPFINTPPSNQEKDNGNRVKRLSGRSTGSLGPVLTIADDADSVLLGQGEQKSTGPSTGDVGSGSATQERSFSTLAGRISRQTISRMSGSVSSRSSTPQPVEKANQVKPAVKIYPIRDMRPPRRDEVDSKTRSTSSPLPRKSAFIGIETKTRTSVTSSKRDSLASSTQIATRQGVKGTEHGIASPNPRDSAVRIEGKDESEDSAKVSPPKPIPSKAGQVLGIKADGSDERPSSPALPRTSNKGSASEAKKSTANGEINPKSIKAARRNSGYMPLKDNSPGSRSASPPQDTRGDRKISPDSIKSGSTWHSLVRQGTTVSKTHERLMSATTKSPVQPRSETELPVKGKASNVSGRQKDVDANDKASKVKAKRSFRNFFHKRDGKRTEKMPKPADKRSSLTMPVNVLAKRFRHSASLADAPSTASVSKASLVRPTSEIKAPTVGEFAGEGKSSSALGEARPATCSDPSVIINKIAGSVASLPEHSPDRLRGLEIAETLLNAVDAHKQARISAAKAKKHARDAELNAERAGVELERMQKLCEPDFDHETLQAIKNLMRCAGAVGQEEQGRVATATASAQ